MAGGVVVVEAMIVCSARSGRQGAWKLARASKVCSREYGEQLAASRKGYT